jgi:hypothetical protein
MNWQITNKIEFTLGPEQRAALTIWNSMFSLVKDEIVPNRYNLDGDKRSFVQPNRDNGHLPKLFFLRVPSGQFVTMCLPPVTIFENGLLSLSDLGVAITIQEIEVTLAEISVPSSGGFKTGFFYKSTISQAYNYISALYPGMLFSAPLHSFFLVRTPLGVVNVTPPMDGRIRRSITMYGVIGIRTNIKADDNVY